AIVMDHHALTDARFFLADALADSRDNAARLVPRDDGPRIAETELLRGLARRRPIEFEIAAAHARGFDLQYDLARPRGRVLELAKLHLPVTGKNCCLHRACSLVSPSCRPQAWTRRLLCPLQYRLGGACQQETARRHMKRWRARQ